MKLNELQGFETAQCAIRQTTLGDLAEQIIRIALEIKDQSNNAYDNLFGPKVSGNCDTAKESPIDNLEIRLEKALNILSQANNTLADILPRI
jgi:hypothetical protein